ncbi:hypothetical protein KDA23_03290 [Candidatus Saccharibacteria bacterium]|nr:hypothetical protein [Candidatus Saccharibacteria bacterium]
MSETIDHTESATERFLAQFREFQQRWSGFVHEWGAIDPDGAADDLDVLQELGEPLVAAHVVLSGVLKRPYFYNFAAKAPSEPNRFGSDLMTRQVVLAAQPQVRRVPFRGVFRGVAVADIRFPRDKRVGLVLEPIASYRYQLSDADAIRGLRDYDLNCPLGIWGRSRNEPIGIPVEGIQDLGMLKPENE